MERSLSFIALFAALIAALGLLPPLSLGLAVPITAQSLGVMLAGTMLGARRGALAVALFLALVALGLPLLAGGRGGLAVFAGPTAGFLFGFVPAAAVAGFVMSRSTLPVFWAAFIGAVLGGIGALYPLGILGMSVVLGKSLNEAALIAIAFLPGDLVKAVLTGLITAALATARPRAHLARA